MKRTYTISVDEKVMDIIDEAADSACLSRSMFLQLGALSYAEQIAPSLYSKEIRSLVCSVRETARYLMKRKRLARAWQ
jgi:hypothetical protein